MKNRNAVFFCVVLFLFAGTAVFSETDSFSPEKLQDSMKNFSNKMAGSLPFNSTLGLNWSDAYIGNFPHFGVGISLGLTTMDLEPIEKLIEHLSPPLPDWLYGFAGFPIPGYTVEARLGGLGFFDAGLKVGAISVSYIDYFLLGGDIRFAVLKGDKAKSGKRFAPTVSVGAGFNYLSGALKMTAGDDRSFEYYNPVTEQNEAITLKAPVLTADWSTASLDFRAQISKKIAIITPYLGIGASTGWSKAGYGVKLDIEETTGTIDAAEEFFRKAGITNFSRNGFSFESDPLNGWSFRTFGGFSLKAAVVRFDFTGMWNFQNKYGFSIGTRVQL